MFTRDEAVALWHKYNTSDSLWHHALAVEATMKEEAKRKGEDENYWGLVGLLHDVDWGEFPTEHCKKAPELLKEIGADDAFIHAVCSHGWSICSDVEPTLYMEKFLFAIDELTGLVNATALMRPELIEGMTVKSVKKKWGAKGFAAGVNRELIERGANMLSVEVPELIEITITAMSSIKEEIGLKKICE